MPKTIPERETRLLGLEEVAAFLGVTTRTVTNMIARGTLRPVRLPGLRRTLVDRQDLNQLVDRGKVNAAAADGSGR
jgi:excisionase family DNA binding protein